MLLLLVWIIANARDRRAPPEPGPLSERFAGLYVGGSLASWLDRTPVDRFGLRVQPVDRVALDVAGLASFAHDEDVLTSRAGGAMSVRTYLIQRGQVWFTAVTGGRATRERTSGPTGVETAVDAAIDVGGGIEWVPERRWAVALDLVEPLVTVRGQDGVWRPKIGGVPSLAASVAVYF